MTHRASGAASRAAAALLAVVALAVAAPAPAAADDPAVLGSVAISPTTGSVDSSPMLGSATTSAPCPTGHGSNALLRVGPPAGPYSNIVKPATAGGYDRQPVTLAADRSMTAGLGRAPADGPYRIVVQCSGTAVGRHPGRFETAIVVSGNTWQVAGAGGTRMPWWPLAALLVVAVAGAVALLLRRTRRSATRPTQPSSRGPAGSRAATAPAKPRAAAGRPRGGSA